MRSANLACRRRWMPCCRRGLVACFSSSSSRTGSRTGSRKLSRSALSIRRAQDGVLTREAHSKTPSASLAQTWQAASHAYDQHISRQPVLPFRRAHIMPPPPRPSCAVRMPVRRCDGSRRPCHLADRARERLCPCQFFLSRLSPHRWGSRRGRFRLSAVG